MARDHARVQVAIWAAGSDFRTLNRDDQRMYLLLCSQPRLTYCGILDYLPGRLAKLAADDDEKTVETAVWRLEERRYVIVDRTTQELLIRSYVRHDGLLASPNITKAMVKDRHTVLSDLLRDAIDAELRRAYRDEPALAGWEKGVKEADPELYRKVTGRRSVTGSRKGSAKGSDGGSRK